MRFVPLLALSLLVAPLAAQQTRTMVVIPGRPTRVITDITGTLYEVPFSPAVTYAAVLRTYEELKLPREISDSAKGRVETGVIHRRVDIGGKQISTYLSCGDGITGPYADTYRVYMIVMTTVVPRGPDRSAIRSVLLGGAVNVSEGARQPMACESAGRWEIRLHKEVLARAAGL